MAIGALKYSSLVSVTPVEVQDSSHYLKLDLRRECGGLPFCCIPATSEAAYADRR